MPTSYFLKFNNRIEYGSREHFFHFMWGYLFPALYEINRIEECSKETCNRFIFTSCGPVMDRLIGETLSLFRYDFEILEKEEKREGNNITQILVPRWDIWLAHMDTESSTRRFSLYIPFWKWKMFWSPKTFSRKFLASILKVRKMLLEKAGGNIGSEIGNEFKDKYLVLLRSPQHEFYETGGRAEIPTYGSARRSLEGVEEAIAFLRKNNIPVTAFEPGQFSLTEQISIFHICKGIIGIKGAEFANVIWMQPNARVILVRPSDMNTPSVQASLSNMLGLDYQEITTHEGMYPVLNGGELLGLLEPCAIK